MVEDMDWLVLGERPSGIKALELGILSTEPTLNGYLLQQKIVYQ